MTLQQTRQAVHTQPVEAGGGDPFAGGGNTLQQQAAQYANLARQALQDCKGSLEAEEALLRRRNRSAQ